MPRYVSSDFLRALVKERVDFHKDKAGRATLKQDADAHNTAALLVAEVAHWVDTIDAEEARLDALPHGADLPEAPPPEPPLMENPTER